MNENMNNRPHHLGGILTAFAVGAALGAGIALLYAPRSGKDTRKILADKGREWKGFFREKGEDVTTAFNAGKQAMREERAKHERVA